MYSPLSEHTTEKNLKESSRVQIEERLAMACELRLSRQLRFASTLFSKRGGCDALRALRATACGMCACEVCDDGKAVACAARARIFDLNFR